MSDGNRVLEYIIRARDNASAVMHKTAEGFSGLGSKVGDFFRSGIGQMVGFSSVVGGVVAGLALLKKGFEEAMEEQRTQAQFKTLLGGLDAAKKRMEEIKMFKLGAAGGLFDVTDIAKASKNLYVLTEGLLDNATSWRIIGDVAAVTGNTMESVAFAIGKAFGMLKEGMPIDRVIMQLTNLGIIGPETTKVLKDLEAAGASQAEKWEAITSAISKFKNGMHDAAQGAAGDLRLMKASFSEWWKDRGEDIGHIFVEIKSTIDLASKFVKGVRRAEQEQAETEGAWHFFEGGSLKNPTEEGGTGRVLVFRKSNRKLPFGTLPPTTAAADQDLLDKAAKIVQAEKEYNVLVNAPESEESKKKREAAAEKRASDIEARIYAENKAAQTIKNENEDTEKELSEMRMREAADVKKYRIEMNAQTRDDELAAIQKVQEKKLSAAQKVLETTKAWFADFGGQAQGEWGAIGGGARAWTAGAAAARMANKLTDKENARDQARAAELAARVERGTTLSPQAAQWLGDRKEYANTQWLQAEKERLAGITKDRAEKELANIEKEKIFLARKTANSLKKIENDLAANLKAP